MFTLKVCMRVSKISLKCPSRIILSVIQEPRIIFVATMAMQQERKTDSGIEIQALYTTAPCMNEQPGQFPFTRGVHEGMYRDKPWTMRQYAGFSTAEASNERYHFLLQQGVTGLSVAFDFTYSNWLRQR